MSKIEWTEQTWNPIIGCSKISAGCQNCYAEKMADRLARMNVDGYSYVVNTKTRMIDEDAGTWNGKTVFVESALDKPLKRRKPTTYFICSMGDLFHESVPYEWVDRVMAVVALCPQHKFIILTKRADRMKEYFVEPVGGLTRQNHFLYEACKISKQCEFSNFPLTPLGNLIIGVTAENQEMADKRIPLLLQTPAVCRMVSVEPMLGTIDFGIIPCGEFFCPQCQNYFDAPKKWACPNCGENTSNAKEANNGSYDLVCAHCKEGFNGDEEIPECPYCNNQGGGRYIQPDYRDCIYSGDKQYGAVIKGLDWVIVGAESGNNRRFCNNEWIADLVKQCCDAGVPCFVKQIHNQKNKKFPVIKMPEGWPQELPEILTSERKEQ
jgi:protein gp37